MTDERRYHKSFNTAGKNALNSSKVARFESDLLRTNEDIAPQIRVLKFTDVCEVGGKFVPPPYNANACKI